jgi:hypothetical protein
MTHNDRSRDHWKQFRSVILKKTEATMEYRKSEGQTGLIGKVTVGRSVDQ